jgi:hypothetical protein
MTTIQEKIIPDSIVYSDCWCGDNVPDVRVKTLSN